MEGTYVMPKREEPCLPMQLIGSHKLFLTGGTREGSTLTGGLTYHWGRWWYPSWGMIKPESDESRESRVLLGQLVGKMRRIPYGTVQSRKQQWSLCSVIEDSARSAHWPDQARGECIAARSNITEGPTTEDSGDPESRMVLVATHSAMAAAG